MRFQPECDDSGEDEGAPLLPSETVKLSSRNAAAPSWSTRIFMLALGILCGVLAQQHGTSLLSRCVQFLASKNTVRGSINGKPVAWQPTAADWDLRDGRHDDDEGDLRKALEADRKSATGKSGPHTPLPPLPQPPLEKAPLRSVERSGAGAAGSGMPGAVALGNASLDQALFDWLEAHHTAPCDWNTPVWFAPFSPNGIGNKVMSMVMAFHVALMGGKRLVATDWPPSTLRTEYPLDELFRPSACQRLFDADAATRTPIKKCTTIACPLRTASNFARGSTQPHWAHQTDSFLNVPAVWSHLSWQQWWRAITQYLVRPGPKLLRGLAGSLARTSMHLSRPLPHALVAVPPEAAADAASAPNQPIGFADSFARGVGVWRDVPRPLIGAHVRVGDGCWDSKRGGCKYVTAFSDVVRLLQQAGLTGGTIFLATDNETIANQALAAPPDGFVVATLREDRRAVQASHGRREGDDMLHLQLLDLALLSQADVLAGVFGSTFIKTALQLGHAAEYVSLDGLPWCPLLRCYWGWRDLCHNCEACDNHGGVGEACVNMGYHTPVGLNNALHRGGPERRPFRAFMGTILEHNKCEHFSEHPLRGRPVVGSVWAPLLPPQPAGLPSRVCAKRASNGKCECGFVRYVGVDNIAHSRDVHARRTLRATSLEGCESACCAVRECHSSVWRANTSTCVAALTNEKGVRKEDRCWHPMEGPHAISSLRAAGAWER